MNCSRLLILVAVFFLTALATAARAERILLYAVNLAAPFPVEQALLVAADQKGLLEVYQLELESGPDGMIGTALIVLPPVGGPTEAAVVALGRQGEVWAEPKITSFKLFQGSEKDARRALQLAQQLGAAESATKSVVATNSESVVSPEDVQRNLQAESVRCEGLQRSRQELAFDSAALEGALQTLESQDSRSATSKNYESDLGRAIRELVELKRAAIELRSRSMDEALAKSEGFDRIPINELERKLSSVRSEREVLEDELVGLGLY